MAIAYVGGQVAGRANPASALSVNFALTGGLAAVPAAGDLVIVTCVTGSAAGNPAMAVTTPNDYTPLGQLNQSAVTADTSMNVSYKIMGGTPDTAVTIPGTGNNAFGEAYAIQVFRGVDATTPMDVAAVSGGGTGTGRPNPSSINHNGTAGIAVVICGGGAAGTGANYTAPANYATNFLTANGADTTDAMVGCGYRLNPADPEDPAVYTGGTTGATDSWCSYTLALRPVTAVAALFEASISGAGTVVAAIATAIEMLGSLAGSAVLAGALTTAITLAAAPTGTGTVAGALTTEIRAAGVAPGVATVAGALTTEIRLGAGVAGQGVATGALTTEIRVAGALAGTATTSAELFGGSALLVAQASGTGTVAGALTTEIRCAGSLSAAATTTGDLAAGAAGALMEAAASGTGTTSGALTTEIRMASSALGEALVTGTLAGPGPHVLAAQWKVVPAETKRVLHVPIGAGRVAIAAAEDRTTEEA